MTASLSPGIRPAGRDAPQIVRRVPLPPAGPDRLQLTVTPGTRTKSGPEYFGLPFTLAGLSSAASAPTVIRYHPPAIDPATPPPFGRLKMRVRFPKHHYPQADPLVTTGTYQAGDFLFAHYSDAQHIRFGFDHWFRGGPVSKPIPIDYDREHDLEISMGSLFPPRESVVFATMTAAQVAEAKDRVVVWLDGRVVLDSAGECYESNQADVTPGLNLIKGTTSRPQFYGEILSTERVWPWPEPAGQGP